MKKVPIKKINEGFTLIEIIVSLAIFTIVAVVAVGAFLKIIDANQKSQTLKTAINNVNFALESITREMRVGSNYHCYPGEESSINTTTVINGKRGLGCPDGGKTVAFVSSNQDPTKSCYLVFAYQFKTEYDAQNFPINTRIDKAEQRACNDEVKFDSVNAHPIISNSVTIDEYLMTVTTPQGSGTATADGPQPRVFLRIKGHAGQRENSKTFFDVQTTISQRNPFK